MSVLRHYERDLRLNNLDISLDVLHKMLDNVIINKEKSSISLSTLISLDIIEEDKISKTESQLNS